MKLSKWLIGSCLTTASIATFCPAILTSCSKTFEAYVSETHFRGSEMFFHIPVSFSYSPKHDVRIKLEGKNLDGLSLVKDRILIIDNQATIDLQIADSLWQNKEFNFDIQIIYDDFEPPFILEGFNILYFFEQPETKDKIKLASEKNTFVEDYRVKYKIQFETCPIGEVVYTSLANTIVSDSRYQLSTSTQVDVRKEEEKFLIYFYVRINKDIPLELDYWATFDLVISFTNSKGVLQNETIVGCSLVRAGQK